MLPSHLIDTVSFRGGDLLFENRNSRPEVSQSNKEYDMGVALRRGGSVAHECGLSPTLM